MSFIRRSFYVLVSYRRSNDCDFITGLTGPRALAFMNTWNPEAARSLSDNLSTGFLAKPSLENHVIVPDPRVSFKIRELVSSQDMEPMDPATFAKASDMVSAEGSPEAPPPFRKPHFALATMWMSELGDRSKLEGMLSYADATFNPTWEEGGLFYPCRKSETPFDYKSPDVDVVTGNTGVAYGRLNVFNGQRKMYENPWTDEHFAAYPFVANVDLSSDVDFLRGNWDDRLKALAVTMRSWDGKTKW